MGTSALDAAFRFNGVISTDKTVMQNLETMCSATGCWLSYDVNDGLWSVIINEPGDSIASFDDSNIIGSIQVSNTGLLDLYNAVKVSFPHQDLNDVRDFVRYEIPAEDRNPNEPDRDLNIEYDIFNDPVQADVLAITELKQARVDKVINFTTDYSKLGLKAGDIIDVTNSVYGFENKKFRITSIVESDAEDGSINIAITALEYSDNVYDLTDLYRYERSNLNGIVSIGSIGAPTTPDLSVVTVDSRPRLLANVQVPGIAPVEKMELWYSSDNSNFILVDTESPTNGGTFTVGDYVNFDYDKAVTGNAYVKARGLNSTTTGDFSAVATYVDFNNTQAPDVIKQGTPIVSPSGTILPSAYNLGFYTPALSDLIQYSANSHYKGMVYSSYNQMFAVNGTISEVFNNVGSPENLTIQVAGVGVALEAAASALSRNKGIALYITTAPWDAVAYASDGLGGLAWEDWTLINHSYDEYGYLAGIDSYFGQRSTYTFVNDTSANPYVIAFGYSSTRVPAYGDLSIVTDPVSGASVFSYQIPYSTNTVLDTASTTETPGITATLSLTSGITGFDSDCDLFL